MKTTQHTCFLFLTALFALSVWVGTASATITPTGPFIGTYSETFESFQTYIQSASLLPEGTSLMGGFATISSLNQDMGIYNNINLPISDPSSYYLDAPFAWSLSYAGVSDGTQGLALGSSGDAATITFSSAVTAFGGYFGANYGTGSGSSGNIIFNFSDGSSDSFIYNDPNANGTNYSPLTWDGWDFSTGITSVTISSDYLAMDGLQASVSTVPEPTTISLVALGLLGAMAIRRRSLIGLASQLGI